MVEAIRHKADRTSLILFVSVFIYLCIWVIPINMHSDGLFHLNVGRGIVEDGALLELAPHTVENISYPETFHVMLALVYMWGGEGMVKFLSPLCGALVALFIYLMLKPVSRCLGVLSGVFAIGFLTHTFLNPLLEPYLLAGTITAVYFCYLFLKTGGKKYLWLASLFLGLSMSIKQPGLMLFGVILVVGIVVASYELLKRGHRQLLNSVPLLAIIPIAISFAPLRDQVARNGELYPGVSHFSYIDWRGYEALSRIVKEYLLGPAFWERPSSWLSFLLIPILVLFILGAVYLYKRDKLLTYILLPVLVGEVLLAFMTSTLIRHYHVIGVALAPVFLMSSMFFVRKVMNLRLASLLLAALLVIFGVSGVLLYNKGWWGNSGRCSDQHISMYKEVGEFIKRNTGEDSVFLAADREGLAYYSLREGGTQIRNDAIFHCADDEAVLRQLISHDINYIFIESRLIEHENGCRIPSEGLVSYIDKSPYFEEVFSVQGDEGDAFILYQVLANIDGTKIRDDLITDIDDLSEYYLSKQVRELDAINYGSFTGIPSYKIDDPYMERYSESPLTVLAYAWSCPESRYYQDATVLKSVRLGLLCLYNVQCWTGGFPVGTEVEVDGAIQPFGVQLQDYGDTPHQFFLGDCALYAYNTVYDYLSETDKDKISTMLERLFEFSVIRPANHSARSLTYEGLAHPFDHYKEQVKVPKTVLDSAARVDIVLRVEKAGDPEAAIWEAHIGDQVLELDTTKINPNGINPYREYDPGNPCISIAVWQIDDVDQILPQARLSGEDYLLDIVFEKVAAWDIDDTYAIVRSQGDAEPTWISSDGQDWQQWKEDLALQVWVYGENTELVGSRAHSANQEAGRFYLIHKSRWLFDACGDARLLNLASQAFEKEAAVFGHMAEDGVFPESNDVIAEAVANSSLGQPSSYGGWSPGHGLISMYLVALIAEESHDPRLAALVQETSKSLEYLMYEDDEGYKVMNATTARDNNEVILTRSSKNLFALGFAVYSDSSAVKGILRKYLPLSPVDYLEKPYPLFAHQIDSMPIVSIHDNLEDRFGATMLPTQRTEGFIRNFPEAKLLAVKTRDYLYYISYGNATPSGGCIADKFDLATERHEILSTGASLDYGQPLFEIRDSAGSSSVWDTQAGIEILSDVYPFKVRFTGYLRYPDQTPTAPYVVEYTFLDDMVETQRWLNGEPYTDQEG